MLADDILIYGRGKTLNEAIRDHDEKLRNTLQTIQKAGLKLNRKKARVGLRQVCYYGHLLTSEGLKPDPQKVKAVAEMRRPENVKEVQCLLGMSTYLGKFSPQLSEVCEPLRRLTKKNAEFQWGREQQHAFERLKQLTTTTPVLQFYNVEEKVQIECDASSFGLGAVLKQGGKPVIYASRTLSATEQKYAQIEKECLTIVFACSRFDRYVCGKAGIEVKTDHQPLVNIFNKPVVQATKRVQRMMLRLQRYDIIPKYKNGKEMFIADLL